MSNSSCDRWQMAAQVFRTVSDKWHQVQRRLGTRLPSHVLSSATFGLVWNDTNSTANFMKFRPTVLELLYGTTCSSSDRRQMAPQLLLKYSINGDNRAAICSLLPTQRQVHHKESAHWKAKCYTVRSIYHPGVQNSCPKHRISVHLKS